MRSLFVCNPISPCRRLRFLFLVPPFSRSCYSFRLVIISVRPHSYHDPVLSRTLSIATLSLLCLSLRSFLAEISFSHRFPPFEMYSLLYLPSSVGLEGRSHLSHGRTLLYILNSEQRPSHFTTVLALVLAVRMKCIGMTEHVTRYK